MQVPIIFVIDLSTSIIDFNRLIETTTVLSCFQLSSISGLATLWTILLQFARLSIAVGEDPKLSPVYCCICSSFATSSLYHVCDFLEQYLAWSIFKTVPHFFALCLWYSSLQNNSAMKISPNLGHRHLKVTCYPQLEISTWISHLQETIKSKHWRQIWCHKHRLPYAREAENYAVSHLRIKCSIKRYGFRIRASRFFFAR